MTPRPCFLVAGVSLCLAHAVVAAPPVPRSTFGRAPVPPLDLTLLTPVDRTPKPTSFTAIVEEERTLPVTAATARTMKFEHQLTPVDRIAPLVPETPEPTGLFRFTPATPGMPPAGSEPSARPSPRP